MREWYHRFDVMSSITKEKVEDYAKALENIGVIPEGSLEQLQEQAPQPNQPDPDKGEGMI